MYSGLNIAQILRFGVEPDLTEIAGNYIFTLLYVDT